MRVRGWAGKNWRRLEGWQGEPVEIDEKAGNAGLKIGRGERKRAVAEQRGTRV